LEQLEKSKEDAKIDTSYTHINDRSLHGLVQALQCRPKSVVIRTLYNLYK